MASEVPTNLHVAREMLHYINASPSPFHAVDEAVKLLSDAGFSQLHEKDSWSLTRGEKYFFTRNGSSIIAFAIGKKFSAGEGFHIVAAHTDSPCLKLKPVSKVTKGGFLEVGVQTYGGGLWHTWFDRDLSLAGRVILKQKSSEDETLETFSQKLVRIPKPILRIPSLAIHLNRDVNSAGFVFNNQTHLVPVLATVARDELSKPAVNSSTPSNSSKSQNANSTSSPPHHTILLKTIADELGCVVEDICDFELCLFDTQAGEIGGALDEFVFSSRLDNLCMSFCSIKSLISSTADSSLDDEKSIRMICLFDNEEIGSNSAYGAQSPLLLDAIKRITLNLIPTSTPLNHNLIERSIQKSFLVSADMAHSLHPNYPEKHEENHQPFIHRGLTIKINANQRYATTSITSFLFKEIAKKHDLPFQEFVVRNDMACGSTIGPILASGVGIRTVDVGIAQLSMHSIREMCGVDDVDYACRHFKHFFLDFSSLDSRLDID